MINWRRLKNATLTAAIASSAFVSTVSGAADAASVDKDFKFPIVLCRFKQAVLKHSGGVLKVVADKDWGPEHAFPVGNVRMASGAINGDFVGIYEIPNSSYRLRLEGDIVQALDVASNHQLRLKTVLEKKLDKADSSGKLWQEVGQTANSVAAHTQSDGMVWENVYPYTFNSAEMQRYFSGGKLKQDLVIAGIRDGYLDKGSVFKVGPACGFLDAKTAKSVASAEDRQRFRVIFDRIADVAAAPAPVVAAQPEPAKKIELKLPEAAPAQVASADVPVENRDQQEQQNLAQAHADAHAQDPAQTGAPLQQAQSGQQEMSPELQAQLIQQNQLADQAAAAYNFQQQQAQNGMAQVGVQMPGAPGDGRDPASAQMPQVNTTGQMAQNLQALESPEQVQQHLNMLEQQRQVLAQQQSMIDQQQAFLAQRQQDMAASNPSPGSDATQAIQTSQAAPVGQSF
jgi:hypothetical protein